MLRYNCIESINVFEEIKKIEEEKNKISINFNQNKKEDLFLLGILFASGKTISTYNISSNQIDEKKSFNKMAYYWTLFEEKTFLNVSNIKNKGFLICPVRNADKIEKERLKEIIETLSSKGYEIYYPARDTNQNDNIGFRICVQNAQAIAEANNVFIYYDSKSMGTMFDLGVTYYLQNKYPNRNFYVMNLHELKNNTNDFGRDVILKMCEMSNDNSKMLILEHK